MQFNISIRASHILTRTFCYLQFIKKPRLSKTEFQLLLQLVGSSIWLKAPVIKRRTVQVGSDNQNVLKHENRHEMFSLD